MNLDTSKCMRVVVLGTMIALPAIALAQTQPAPAAPAAAQAGATPQAGPPSDAELAKQLANPVAALVSVPFQFNWEQPVGPDKDSRFIMNFQPVIPLGLNEDWNMILRWIMPFIGQPVLFEGGTPASGLGDIVASVFFSPAKPGKYFIWGAGPVLLLPTNANAVLGSSKWAAGPTFVILKQAGGFSASLLVNALWSFAGDDRSGGVERGDVNVSLIQPGVSYTTKQSITLGMSLEASANWRLYSPGPGGSLQKAEGNQWTIPLMFTATKLTRFGPLPMSIGGGVGWFVKGPSDAPNWRLRMVGAILLPRK